ncbi:MAG: hypothetical protein PHX30_03450 [Candidatus Pacebacteria bacterium]|nr:hypothetical protein [Candidatus Paceibacterota bacterium]
MNCQVLKLKFYSEVQFPGYMPSKKVVTSIRDIKITAYMSGHLTFGSTAGRVQNFEVE